MARRYQSGTLGEWLEYLGADPSSARWAPFWPPDAFAIGAALLRRTGGYVDLVNGAALSVLAPEKAIDATGARSSKRLCRRAPRGRAAASPTRVLRKSRLRGAC